MPRSFDVDVMSADHERKRLARIGWRTEQHQDGKGAKSLHLKCLRAVKLDPNGYFWM